MQWSFAFKKKKKSPPFMQANYGTLPFITPCSPPPPFPQAEQKHLKRIRRKIKNKISAQESRKRKKEYVDGLENRVKICTDRNKELKREVDCLRQQNTSLMAQLKKLQAVVSQYNPSKVQAGSVMLVVVMSFAMFFIPKFRHYGGPQAVRSELLQIIICIISHWTK